MLSKTLTLGLAVSLMGIAFSTGARADNTPSPEATVLETAITLQGQDLPSAQRQTELNQALSTYFATAPQEGQQARFQQALVDLHLLSPEQASAFVANADAVATRVSASDASGEAQTEMISNEITELARTSLAGAQFSSAAECASEITGALGVGALSGYIEYLIGESRGDRNLFLASALVGSAIGAFAELIVIGAGNCPWNESE